MANEVAKPMSPMEEFQENLKKSLRDDIARMLPEAALADMIQRVVNEEFFASNKFKEMIIDAMRPRLMQRAGEIAERMAPHVEQKMTDVIETGISRVMLEMVDKMFQSAFQEMGGKWQFQQTMANVIRNIGQNGMLR